ncbi:MAG: CAP domain-containing protein [Polyangiales bacterium]
MGDIGDESGLRLGPRESGTGASGGSGALGTGGTDVVGMPECGNRVVDSGESCDPPGSCPTSCDDGNACTSDVLSGSAATCDVSCDATVIELCADDDGCCPTACSASDDNDCSPSCGNGTIESGETCDPAESCPVSCDDQNACTTDAFTGSAGNCNVACSHTNVVVCSNDDGCCPSSCSGANDNDCMNTPMCGGAGPATTPLDIEEQNFLQLLNQHRTANGRDPVAACTSLSRASQGHSEDMRDQDYFDHSGLNGSSPIERACDACYESCGVTGWGENIAAGNSGAQGTFNQWVNSPGHNANMLDSGFDVVGIGRATGGGTYGVYWTTVFGGRSDSSCN